MAHRISPKVVHVTHVTKNGECQVNITLDLNINLTSDEVSISAVSREGPPSLEDVEKIKDFEWALPDFEGEEEKIKFGKDVKQ